MGRGQLNHPPRFAAIRPIRAAAFTLGVSCLTTQLALMRELLCVFAGNELVLGVVLGNWLLLMGLGAALARAKRRLSHLRLAVLLIFTAITPPALIVAVRGLRQFVFLPGAAVGVFGTATASLAILAPYCLAAGFCLVLACELAIQAGDAQGAGRVYALDSLGSVLGGALFGFVLVFWLESVAILVVAGMLNLAVAAWLAGQMRRERGVAGTAWLALAAGLAFCGAVVLAVGDLDARSTALQFPGQRLLFRGQSPYGRLVVAESAGQTNFFENGVVLASVPSIEQAEESAHLAMAQRPGTRRVLLIGGALTGTAREILRHGVAQLDCVEMDPLVLRIGREFLPGEFADARLRLLATDARQFVRRTAARYDVVLVALPDPTTAQLNRFFTREFFAEVRRILEPDGVLSLAVGRYENYASPELVRVLSCARRTAAARFPNVLVLPGSRAWFLASTGPLTADIAPALEHARIKPRWVTRSWLAAMLTPDRLADVQRAAGEPAPVNRDFAPVLYYLSLRHWSSQFEGGWGWLAVLLSAVVGVFVLRLRGAACVIFASGFAGSAIEVVLLLAMQILVGSLYQQVALVLTVFMAGLAAGALVATRWLERNLAVRPGAEPPAPNLPGPGAPLGARFGLSGLAFAIAGLAAALPWVLPALDRFGTVTIQGLIAALTFGLACVVGAQFPLANRLESATRHAVARLYTADFLGACGGAFLTSALLVPLVGLAGVCGLAGGLNLLAGLLGLRRPHPA